MVMQVLMDNTVAKGQCKCKMGNAPHTLPTHYERDGIDFPIYMYIYVIIHEYMCYR